MKLNKTVVLFLRGQFNYYTEGVYIFCNEFDFLHEF